MRTFIPIWSKYRPVFLKLMIDSSEKTQHYQLSQHEFKALDPKLKGGYAFNLQVVNGKAVNGLKDSIVAQDLWEILQLSPKATELISGSSFEFRMDKNFVLYIQRLVQENDNKQKIG